MHNKIKFKIAKFEVDENFVHPLFTKVAIWIATYGENANGSDITRDAFVNAIPTLFNIPILGEWNESIEDFKGHGGKIVISDDGIEWIQTTKPYGCVPESCNPRWELDENGVEYLVCDGILWTDRYEEALKVEENTNNQSMEIEVVSSEDIDGVMQITDFIFSGLCILGQDTKPCFPSAKIVYSLNKDEFKQEFNLLLNEIKNINFNEGGNKNNMKKEEIIAKYSNLKGEKYEAIINNADLTLVELDKKLFSLSVSDLRDKIREELSEQVTSVTDYWGDTYECQQYWFEDIIPTDNIAIVYDNNYVDYGIPYTLDNDDIVLDFANAKRYIRGDWRLYVEGSTENDDTIIETPMQSFDKHNKEKVEEMKSQFTEKEIELNKVKGEFVDLQAKFTEIETEKSELTNEVETLKQFKSDIENQSHKDEIDSVFEEFSELKSVEGFNELFEENKYDFEVEDLKVKLKVFAYDNNVVTNKKPCKTKNSTKKTSFSLIDNVKKPISNIDNDWEEVSKYYKENNK